MKTIRCLLNCEPDGAATFHMRPATFIVKLCRAFPDTTFRIVKNANGSMPFAEIDPKSLVDLLCGYFRHGEEVTLNVEGKCEIMASEFFKTAWENLGDYTAEFPASQERLARLIDETFGRIHDPDVEEMGAEFTLPSQEIQIAPDEECRSVAVINDRLHNLSLPVIPQIARKFKCRLQISFEVPTQGIFSFTMEPEGPPSSEERSLEKIMQLPIEVGTRITILTSGPTALAANAAVKNLLQSLWQCDHWLRSRSAPIESDATISELLEFAEKTCLSQSPEYGFIQNPYISNLLTKQHVFVNSVMSAFTKDDVLNQLAAAHACTHKLETPSILERVTQAESREPIVLRDGFAISHGAMDRAPRISITFGVYPKGVVWDNSGRIVRLVSMIVFAKDTYGTWRDYLRKLAIVFRANPNLQNELIESESSERFRSKLRQAETAMIK